MLDLFKAAKVPAPKFNESLFEAVTTDKIRVSFTNAVGHYTAISEIQVFNSGRDVPEVVNDAPIVTIAADSTKDGNLSTTLVATVSDDGLPEDGELTYGWETVSTPDDAAVIFSNDKAIRTSITGTVAGENVLQVVACVCEWSTERPIKVNLEEK